MPTNGSHFGGKSFFVRDSYVWAEIHYLDSPSDYRECLPQYIRTVRVDSELVFLDSCSSRAHSKLALGALPFWLSIISGVALCVLVYTSI